MSLLRRPLLNTVVTLATAVVVLTTTTAWAQSQPSTGATAHHAEAIFSLEPATIYASGAQSDRVKAAAAALARCREANLPTRLNAQSSAQPNSQLSRQSSYCELISSNGKPITRGTQLRAQDPDRPLYLWRYQGPSSTIYLAGSIHAMKAGMYPLPNQYAQAFAASQTLVMEVDQEKTPSAELQATLLRYARLSPGQSLRQSMDSDTYASLVTAGIEFGIPFGQMQGFKPAFAYQQLSLMSLVALGYDPELGVENHFIRQMHNGAEGPKHILELESLGLQFDVLFNQPIDVQIAVLKDALTELDNIEPMTAALMREYMSGDDQAMAATITDQVGNNPLSQHFAYTLLQQRNLGMARKIAALLDAQGNFFVLVGAAHLAGAQSIIELLEERGINGQRIYANDQLALGSSRVPPTRVLP